MLPDHHRHGVSQVAGVFVGDTILVTSPQGYVTPFEVVPKFRHFRVVGVLTQVSTIRRHLAFTTLDAAQRLFDLAEVVSVIEFRRMIFISPTIAEAIRQPRGRV